MTRRDESGGTPRKELGRDEFGLSVSDPVLVNHQNVKPRGRSFSISRPFPPYFAFSKRLMKAQVGDVPKAIDRNVYVRLRETGEKIFTIFEVQTQPITMCKSLSFECPSKHFGP